jgi:hypothetical protein
MVVLFDPNLTWSFIMLLGRVCAGPFTKSPEMSTAGVKTCFRCVKTCIEATFIDRIKPNMSYTLETKLRGYNTGVVLGGSIPLYHHRGQNLGVKTRFMWVKTCIEATFIE